MPLPFEYTNQRSVLMDVIQAPTFQTLNYSDKNLWSALYGDEVETLKEKIQQGIKLDEIKAKLKDLQCMVGRLGLSPVVYSLGLLDLQKFLRKEINEPETYLGVIKAIRREWRETLRNQKAFALENFFTDVSQAIGYVAEIKWEVQAAQDVLNYYFHLIDEPFYQQTVDIAKSFFNEFFIEEFAEEDIHILTDNDMQTIIQKLHQCFVKAVLSLPRVEKSNEPVQETKPTKLLIKPNQSYFNKIWSKVKTITQYTIDHPIQAMIMGLAAQTAATAALKVADLLNKQAIGEEFQVNTYSNSTIQSSSVTHLTNGNFVVAWQNGHQGQLGYEIFGQLFDGTGNKIESEFQIYTDTETNSVVDPSIADLTNGSFVVIWETFGQLFDSSGSKIGGEFSINNYYPTIAYVVNPSVASFTNSNFVVVWADRNYDDGYDIYGQLFDSTGTEFGSKFQVDTNTTIQSQGLVSPSVTCFTNNNFVIIWAVNGIYGQLFNSTANKISSEFKITSTGLHPTVASLINDNFVVIWECSMNICGQLFNTTADIISSKFQVNTEAKDVRQLRPSVAGLTNGNFVVSWQSSYGFDNKGEVYDRIYVQLFNSNSSKIGDEFRVDSNDAAQNNEPSVASLADENFVIIWQHFTNQDKGLGVYGRILNEAYLSLSSKEEKNRLLMLLLESVLPGVAGLIIIGAAIKYFIHYQKAKKNKDERFGKEHPFACKMTADKHTFFAKPFSKPAELKNQNNNKGRKIEPMEEGHKNEAEELSIHP